VSLRYLSLTEREQITDGIAQGRSLRTIAAVLDRSPSTMSREVARIVTRRPVGMGRSPLTGRRWCRPAG
jgi:IS30 family transposase